MSSIQNVACSSTQSLSQAYLQRAAGASQGNGLPPGLEKRLDAELASSGLTEDQQASLKSDLQAALQEQFDSGSATPPDPESVKSAISGVLEKYGLDGDQLAQRLGPPPGPPPGGPPPGSGGNSGYDDSSSTSLEETLQQLLEQWSETNSDATPEETAQYLTSALIGLDAKA
ncbi:hypothetical protein GC163_11495 [bacterium]|nr:hypothetical protein [bacterium]